jgi:hypothetical protein
MISQDELLQELIKIHARYTTHRRPSTAEAQMCTMWPIDPPDVLEDTEPFDALCDLVDIQLEEEFANELFDMSVGEAAEALFELMQSYEEDGE